jgi:predicted SprT family Zn-dependent metalloprotease
MTHRTKMTIKTLDGQALTFDFGAELHEIAAVTRETVERIARAQENGTLPADHDVREVRITSEFNGRFSRRLGDACYRRHLLRGECRYSRPLWPFADAAERRETVIHEVCHVLAFHIFNGQGIKAHGAEWKLVMRLAGANGARCHYVPLHVARKAITYRCSGCGKVDTFTVKTLKRMLNMATIEGITHNCGGQWHEVAFGIRGGRDMHAQAALSTTPATATAPAHDETTGTTYTGTTAHRIEQFLTGHRGQWFSPNAIADAIGKSPVTVRRYAPKLVAKGTVKRTTGDKALKFMVL